MRKNATYMPYRVWDGMECIPPIRYWLSFKPQWSLQNQNMVHLALNTRFIIDTFSHSFVGVKKVLDTKYFFGSF